MSCMLSYRLFGVCLFHYIFVTAKSWVYPTVLTHFPTFIFQFSTCSIQLLTSIYTHTCLIQCISLSLFTCIFCAWKLKMEAVVYVLKTKLVSWLFEFWWVKFDEMNSDRKKSKRKRCKNLKKHWNCINVQMRTFEDSYNHQLLIHRSVELISSSSCSLRLIIIIIYMINGFSLCDDEFQR